MSNQNIGKQNIEDEETGKRYSIREFNERYPINPLKKTEDFIKTRVSDIQTI